MLDINFKIKTQAKAYVGIEEIRGNLGFKKKSFTNLMRWVGWKRGEAWCAYLAELVWREAYKRVKIDIDDELSKLFSALAVKTFRNFKKAGYVTTNKTPIRGALVVWQRYKYGKPHWSGHIGVVTEVQGKIFKSVEGNTNDGKSREGYKVAEHIHDNMAYMRHKEHGLRLIGFVYPKYSTMDEIRKLKAFQV